MNCVYYVHVVRFRAMDKYSGSHALLESTTGIDYCNNLAVIPKESQSPLIW